MDFVDDDGVFQLAFWNAPTPSNDPEIQACYCALELQHALATVLAARLAEEGLPPISVRVGIHGQPFLPENLVMCVEVGPVLVGNVGSSLRMDYTVLGDSVNVASRLEQLNKSLGTKMLVSDAVCKQNRLFLSSSFCIQVVAMANDHFHFRPVGRVFLKNREQGAFVFELLGKRGSVSPLESRLTELQSSLVYYLGTGQSLQSFSQSKATFFAGQFANAISVGEEIGAEFPDYLPARVLLANARSELPSLYFLDSLRRALATQGTQNMSPPALQPPASSSLPPTEINRGTLRELNLTYLSVKTEATPRVIGMKYPESPYLRPRSPRSEVEAEAAGPLDEFLAPTPRMPTRLTPRSMPKSPAKARRPADLSSALLSVTPPPNQHKEPLQEGTETETGPPKELLTPPPVRTRSSPRDLPFFPLQSPHSPSPSSPKRSL